MKKIQINIGYLLIVILSFLGNSQRIIAQTTTCTPSTAVYQAKHDGTGFVSFNNTEIEGLNELAVELVKTLPVEFCDQFKVYDYAFSPLLINTGGFKEQFEYIKSIHEAQYYLIFVRETDENNELKKIWVALKLPSEERFPCLKEMGREVIRLNIEGAVNKEIKEQGARIVEIEKKGINLLTAQVAEIVHCCGERSGCAIGCPNLELMSTLLIQNGFVSLGDIRIKPKSGNSNNTADIQNYAQSLDLESESIENFAKDIQKELSKRKNSKIYITDDTYYCTYQGFYDAMTNYSQSLDDYDVIIHLSKKDDNGNGEMWVKIQEKLFISSEDVDKSQLARLIEDPIISKYKAKVAYSGLSEVKGSEVNNKLLKDNRKLFDKPGKDDVLLFDNNNYLFYAYTNSSAGTFGIIMPDDISYEPNSKHTITLIKTVTSDKKICHHRKNVVWTSATAPKDAKNLQGEWEDLCKNAKPKDANDIVSWAQLQQNLQKYNVEKTYFKHISNNKDNKATYISKDEISTVPPNNAFTTIIEVRENGDGTVTPKVTMRYPSTKDIIREEGKGKSGTWNPSDAKTAFEASFNDAIKDFAQKQGNSSSEPKIDPSKKRAAETILKTDWGDAGVSEPGIEYKGVDILEMLAAGVKTFNDVVDNAKIPDEMWQNPNAADFPVKDKITYPSGVLNGGMSELKGGVQTFGMIADAVMNPSKTAAALEGFAKGLASWDGATKAAGGFITGIIGLDLDEYNKGGEHQRHATGVVIGTIAAQAVTGSLVLSLADIKNAPNKFGKITDKLKGFSENVRKKYSEALSRLAEKTSKDLGSSACDVTCLLGKIGCLTGNTLVEMEEGEMQPLNTVKEGDLVSSFNHKTQQKESKRISQIQRFWASSILVLGLSTGNVIEATPNHPFYVRGEYRQAQELHIGDTLFSKNDKIITLNRIFAKDTTVEVYNLVVADNDNFFAGEDAVLNTRCPWEVIRENYKNLEANLAKSTISADLVGKFTDYASKLPDAELDDFLKIFDEVSENGLKAWEKLAEISGDARRWVLKSEKVIDKLKGRTDAYIDKVKKYYDSHSITKNHPDPPFSHPVTLVNKKGQTLNISVQYDDFGHPDFRDYVPNLPNNNPANPNHVVYKPATPNGSTPDNPIKTLTGEGQDMKDANDWAENTLKLDKNQFEGLPNGRCKIRDHNSPFADNDGWVECTWHHHEDGRTMIPVPSELHGKSGAPHTGGKSVIGNNIQDFFASPTF